MRKTRESEKYKMFLLFIHQSDIKWTINTQANMDRIGQWKRLFNQAYDDLDNDVATIQSEPYIKCRRFIKNIVSQRDNNSIRGMKANCIIIDDLYKESLNNH